MSKTLHFEKSERLPILLLSAILTLAAFLLKFYGETIDSQVMLPTTILYLAISIFIVLFHEFGHKYVASKIGYEVQVILSKASTIASTVVLMLSFARIPLIIGNPIEIDANPRARLGKHRAYDNPKQQAFIAFGGTLGSTIAIAILGVLYNFTGITEFYEMMYIAGLHAVSSLVPWELASILTLKVQTSLQKMHASDGLMIMRYNIIAWIFAISYIISFVMLSLAGTEATFISALIFGAIVSAAYSFFLE